MQSSRYNYTFKKIYAYAVKQLKLYFHENIFISSQLDMNILSIRHIYMQSTSSYNCSYKVQSSKTTEQNFPPPCLIQVPANMLCNEKHHKTGAQAPMV